MILSSMASQSGCGKCKLESILHWNMIMRVIYDQLGCGKRTLKSIGVYGLLCLQYLEQTQTIDVAETRT